MCYGHLKPFLRLDPPGDNDPDLNPYERPDEPEPDLSEREEDESE